MLSPTAVTGVSDMIVTLQPAETASLDKRRLAEIVARLGPRGADDLISRAMEELAVHLARAHKGYMRGHLCELESAAGRVNELAMRMGMPELARVARDVRGLCRRSDGAALAATVARLGRLGEISLMEIWDIQDLSG